VRAFSLLLLPGRALRNNPDDSQPAGGARRAEKYSAQRSLQVRRSSIRTILQSDCSHPCLARSHLLIPQKSPEISRSCKLMESCPASKDIRCAEGSRDQQEEDRYDRTSMAILLPQKSPAI